MQRKNKYINRSHLSEAKTRQIIRLFAQDLSASTIAELTTVSRLTDGWRGYNGLVDVGYEKHYRVHHGQNEFVKGNSHINGIESFSSYAKRRLIKFNGGA